MSKLAADPPWLSWPDVPEQLGISSEVWQWVTERGYSLVTYFAHPDVLLSKPKVAVSYYRMLALMSQKGISYVEFSTQSTEQGKHRLTRAEAERLSKAFNEHISSIFEVVKPTPESVTQLVLLSAGSQIQGSWSNEIGKHAQQNVNRLVVEDLHKRGCLASVVTRRDTVQLVEAGAELTSILEGIVNYKRANVQAGGYLLFGSEPDIAVYNPAGTFAAAIEVKGGTDPAAIQQRVGAAEQAFGRARDPRQSGNPTCRTILLTGILTESTEQYVQHRPQIFNEYYLLGDIIALTEATEKFLAHVRESLGLFSPSSI